MGVVRVREDRLWGKPCLGYSVQARFDEAGIARLTELQTRIAALPPRPRLHWTPPATMHISLFSVIPVRWADEGKEELWEQLRDKVLNAVASSEWLGALTVRFHELVITNTALILSTPNQPEPIRRLRARLNAIVVAASLPSQDFDRTHMTLARPSCDDLLDERWVGGIEHFPVNVEAGIVSIVPIRESVYPTLEYELLT